MTNMKNLQEYLTESSNTQINEGKGVWVVELQSKDPTKTYMGMIMQVCSSEKSARVWCIEQSATYPAWKVQYDKWMYVTGLWNEQNGDKLVITQRDMYNKERTDLQKYGI